MAETFANIIDGWKAGWQGAADGIFSDHTKIMSMIYRGAFFDDGGDGSVMDITPLAQGIIYANGLPSIWQGGTEAGMPFIATSEGVSTDDSGCEGYDFGDDASLSEDTTSLGFPDGDAGALSDATRVCIDDVPYWLLSGSASIKKMGSGRNEFSNYMLSLDKPYGLDALDGERWSGITKEQLVINAVNSWKNNGNKNGWAPFSPDPEAPVPDVSSGDISFIPGVVGLPVCSFREAVEISNGDSGNSEGNSIWPCANYA
ncbi:uncharacterized protein LTR77_004646 [Saxophila tyrrhenica]|uniref:Uncharacterized protein n=1 Tax=Saxophila tyrrhenica TaxID=1690608 RepID=A0AAV9PE24_9PEZI|nr:hypothetical protein LTR77_004646 [Saxophila tyrrhenica]